MKILGFSHEHDSGVAFIESGRLIYAANEERFNREKLTLDEPLKSLKNGIKMFPDFIKNIDCVAVGSMTHISKNLLLWADRKNVLQKLAILLSRARLDKFLFGTNFGVKITIFMLTALQCGRRIRLKRLISSVDISAPIKYVDHHLAHAASAYFTSPWNKALIITLDSQGDGYCSKIFIGEAGKLKKLHSIPFFHSPGHYYLYVALLLGFQPGQEGKVTGLAAYGNYEKTLPIFQARMIFDQNKMSFKNLGYYRYREIDYLKEALRGFSREDIAAGAQKHLENLITEYIALAIEKFASPGIPIALAGGVFANVKLNQKIAGLKEVSGIYIFPHMGDGGLAVGAALAAESKKETLQPEAMSNLYLGPGIGEDDIIHAFKKYNLKFKKSNNIAKETAEFLAAGKIVAVCRGRMEYGPRALGDRSILAEARDKKIHDILNKKLRRSEFMPFAPTIRKEKLAEYFYGWEKCEKSLEFMTITLPVKDKFKVAAPAAIHIDATARPQIVTKDINPFLNELLYRYEQITGIGALINTSFNIHEEPIVCSCEDAAKSYFASKLDALVLENYIVY